MITVLFFAQTKELVGIDKLELTGDYATAEAIREELSKKEGKWDLALEKGKLLVAINQTISSLDSAVSDGDEVAFFPPVTGG
ncbi:molybdopterin synthase sulfur carrier subunit [Aliivibrio sifiae]|uniref:Molybdopterin synthase sulfur carrier subunit n=1 Tax=Aliivibrio sifiae TaxID=566293 RepID=A0A2S7XJN2_9GAMM|nr:molybdopterin synthase sulfur carrier subunit [Aliivibrio sifiae]PQJ93866.1 molybdopterin synthase sulfur carrier subunit [Aliivibrio sifiae]GLR75303.1 molybdopterin synthase sulfur carrier subunit [Aliivibrio sifiae]